MKQTKYRIDPRTKNHSWWVRLWGRCQIQLTSESASSRQDVLTKRDKSDYHVRKTVSWHGGADSLWLVEKSKERVWRGPFITWWEFLLLMKKEYWNQGTIGPWSRTKQQPGLGVSVPSLWPLAFTLLVSLLPLGLKLILSLSCSQTLEDFQPGLQRCSEFPCLFNPVSLCTQPLLSNHLRHTLAFPFSLASAFVVSIGQPRNHVKMVPRGQFH